MRANSEEWKRMRPVVMKERWSEHEREREEK